MHLYKNFFRILKHNKIGVIIYAVIMVIMIISLIAAVNSQTGSDGTVSSSAAITYIDNDHSDLSEGLIDYLSEENTVEDVSGRSERSVQDVVFFNIADCCITIPEGFSGGDEDIELFTSFGGGAGRYRVEEQINDYVSTYRLYENMGYGGTEAASRAKALLTDNAEVIKLVKEEGSTRSMDFVVFYLNQFFSYLMIGFLCLGVGHAVIANNDERINERIETSPVGKKKISLINTLGIMTMGVVVWAVFMALNLILGHGGALLKEYFPHILLNSFVTMIYSCALTSLITSFPINSNVLSMVTNIVSLGMSFISGVFVSQSLMGEGVLKVAQFCPVYWTVLANNMTYAESKVAYDGHGFLLCIGIELLFAAAFAAAAAFVKSSRLSKHAPAT